MAELALHLRKEGKLLGESAIILVLVGTHFTGFERLVKEMDVVAGTTNEEVIMQIGATPYEPRHSKFFRAASYDEMKNLIERARLVVCHAGSGCVLDCLSSGKVPIIVPRLVEFGEARDNHQLELARYLSSQGKAIVVREVRQLGRVIKDHATHPGDGATREGRLVRALREYLKDSVGENKR